MNFKDIVETRYAVKSFDGKMIPEDKILQLKDMMRFAPTSFNLQPWQARVVTEAELKEKLRPASWNQPQITTCSHLFVFCANTELEALTDRLEERLIREGAMPEEKVKGFTQLIRQFVARFDSVQRLAWAQRQTYIALANGMNGARALGFDSCPIEGFDPQAYKQILSLPESLVPTVVMAVGYASDTPRPKLRFHHDEMFF